MYNINILSININQTEKTTPKSRRRNTLLQRYYNTPLKHVPLLAKVHFAIWFCISFEILVQNPDKE